MNGSHQAPLSSGISPFLCGVNIVWAEEAEDTDAKANITGHSAGKTTFCRLFRYVLGERTFGTKPAMELIRKAFPDGYIAAELHFRGRKWAVARPFGSGRMSFIREDVTIEKLLAQRGRTITQESYPKEIGLESLLDELETGTIVQTAEQIRWSHILAWCTRDQEARFQSIHDWRSPRSEADTPSFRFPKAGPLFVMRAVLGLFLPEELRAEERLAELQVEKDRLNKEIDDKRREPQFRVTLYEHQLRQRLKFVFPEERDVDSLPFRSNNLFIEDLERLTQKARSSFEELIEKGEFERKGLQKQIDEFGVELLLQQRTLDNFEVLFALGDSATLELNTAISKRQEQRMHIEELKDSLCTLGDILIEDCSHIQTRQRLLQITELQDANAMKQAEASRTEERQKINDKKAAIQEEIECIKASRQNTIERRDDLAARIREQKYSMRKIVDIYDELVTWSQRRDKRVGYEELERLRRELDSVEKEAAGIGSELGSLIRQHEKNREQLTAIFSGAVKSVLSSERYDGLVSFDNRELAFRITHGSAMTGEAVETLSVLLADVATIIYNSVSRKAHLPGFLLHDSPREADLGIQIYNSFIRFVASLQEHFGEAANCPFQYIITTTTAPPAELQTDKYVKLQLNASSAEGLLLRHNIGAQIPQQRSMYR